MSITICIALVAVWSFSLGFLVEMVVHVRRKDREANASCTHNFIVIAAQPLKDVVPATTSLLRRCSACGLHWATGYLGTWELADFLRKESEVSELERMVP